MLGEDIGIPIDDAGRDLGAAYIDSDGEWVHGLTPVESEYDDGRLTMDDGRWL